jgi:tRNA threonylcarbamoyl adenosine modification protein YeaZ
VLLALNTAQSVHELALLNGDKLLCERRWTNAKEDVEKLVPTLQEMLDEAGATKQDLTDLLVIRGPGSFTSVRVGIAFMNALAEGLHAKLYTLDTFELFARKAATTDPVLVVLTAGGLDVGIHYKGETQVGPLAALLAAIPHGTSLRVAAELPETLNDELRSLAGEKSWHILEAHELQTLGESLATTSRSEAVPSFPFLADLAPVNTALPLYLKDAHITVSKDPWKQAR